MKDVAILTKYYKNYNYGGMLQGYALWKIISEMGYSCDIISYDVNGNSNPVYSNALQQFKQYGLKAAISKITEKVIGKWRFFIKETLNTRVERFDQFMEFVDAGTQVYSDENLTALNSRYRIFVSGSDQVWNPNAVRKLYLQTFVSEGKKRVSYAASIGRNELSQHEAAIMLPEIVKFDFLSVRESTARNLLSRHMDKKIDTVVDPTMLVSREEWDRITSPRLNERSYTLFYFFSDSFNVRKATNEFCNRMNMDMVMIPYSQQVYNLTDGKGECTRLNEVGPREFVSAIKYADYVFTDSFHGAVFSIIYNKQFFVFERNKAGHVSMNSRLYDLLTGLGLKERLIHLSDIEKIEAMPEIDYTVVNAKLNELKKLSIDFLSDALS